MGADTAQRPILWLFWKRSASVRGKMPRNILTQREELYGSRGLEKPETEAYNSRKRIVVEGVLGNGLCRGPATVGAGDQACFVLQPKMWKDQKCR